MAKMVSSVVLSLVLIDPELGPKVRNIFNAVQMIGAAVIGILLTYLGRFISGRVVLTITALLVFLGITILAFV